MNVQAGDMAYTVYFGQAEAGKRNAGRFVEVLSFSGPYQYSYGAIGINTWRVKILGGPMLDATGKAWTGEVYIDDDFLRPIRPDGITTEEVKELFSPSPAKESEKV